MNIELIVAASFAFGGFGVLASIMESPRLSFCSFFLAAVGLGFAAGWWFYSKYHGVF